MKTDDWHKGNMFSENSQHNTWCLFSNIHGFKPHSRLNSRHDLAQCYKSSRRVLWKQMIGADSQHNCLRVEQIHKIVTCFAFSLIEKSNFVLEKTKNQLLASFSALHDVMTSSSLYFHQILAHTTLVPNFMLFSLLHNFPVRLCRLF